MKKFSAKMAMQNTNHLPYFLVSGLAGLGMFLVSCSSNELSPGLEYMPDMYRSPSHETYSESPLDPLNGSARKPVAGTIPRFNEETLPFYEPYTFPNTNEGYEAAGAGLVNPLPASEEILKLGEARYTIYCTPCHGEKGDGQGTLVQRDKFNGVPSYYSENLKNLPEGKMYHSIYYGKNMMGSHASQLNSKERWAIIRWVQKLRADGLGMTAPSDSSAAKKDSLAMKTN
jgi:mono/diheme cytochrome c family protein